MFNKLRIGKKGENIIFGTFVLLYIGWCVNSPDMNIESLKSVLTIGLSVGIIYGLVELGISLKNKYPIIPTNIKDVYSKGDVTATSACLAACDIK